MHEFNRSALLVLCDTAFSWVLYGMVFLLPLFFLPVTSDVLELNKQLLLFVGVFVLLVLQGVRSFLAEEIELKWSPIFIGFGALLVAWLLASIASSYPHNSFVGLDRQEAFSFSSIMAFTVFAILIATTATKERIMGVLTSLLGSAAVASLIGLAQLAGGFVFPWQFSKIPAFNTIGLVDLWGVLVACSTVLSVTLLIWLSVANHRQKQPYSIALALALAFFLITLVIMDDWKLWIGVMIGLLFLLGMLFLKLPKNQKVPWLVAPCFIVVLSLALSIIHLPRVLPLPLAAQPTWKTSVNLTWETLKRAPLFGAGPGNFLTSYTQFRPQEINYENFARLWTVRFDQSSAAALTKIAETGLVGFVGMAVLFGIAGFSTFRLLKRKEEVGEESLPLIGVAAALLSLGFFCLTKPTNMTVALLWWVFLGILASFTTKTIVTVSAQNSNRFLILSSGILSIIVVAGLIGGTFAWQRFSADVAYGQALEDDRRLSGLISSNQQVELAAVDGLIEKLNAARVKDPLNDTYLRTLSQAILFKIQMLVNSSDQSQVQTIQSLTSSAIDIAKQAVALNGRDVRNIENLAGAYRAITPFTNGAELFAEESFIKASQLDPQNPSLKVDLAKMYLDVAGVALRRAEVEKGDAEKQAKKAVAIQAIDKAEKALSEALTLKTDYAQAHYFLGLIKGQQNKKEESLASLSRALEINASLASVQAVDQQLFGLIAAAYVSINEKERALEAVRLSLNLNPDDTQSLWLYGNLLADLGKKESALEVMNKLLSLQPQSTQVQDRIKEIRGEKPTTKTGSEKQKSETESTSTPSVESSEETQKTNESTATPAEE